MSGPLDALDVLYVAPERFRRKPQVGDACRVAWSSLVARPSRPSRGGAKDMAGAWSPARYRDNVRRKDHLVSVRALVLDVDAGGDVERAAEAVSRYRAIVHETFSSSSADPRCRIVLYLAKPVDAGTYETAHAVVRAHLRAHSFEVDEAAKDASRLCFLPVRRPGAPYAFRTVDGASLDVQRLLAAQPPTRTTTWSPARIGHASGYTRGALHSAARVVAVAAEGARNSTLNRETYSVARFDDLDDGTIEAALLPAALAAGLPEREARRVIAGAIHARRRSP